MSKRQDRRVLIKDDSDFFELVKRLVDEQPPDTVQKQAVEAHTLAPNPSASEGEENAGRNTPSTFGGGG